jgi:hypothetical protein
VSSDAVTPVTALWALILLRMAVSSSAATSAMLVPLIVRLPSLPAPSV